MAKTTKRKAKNPQDVAKRHTKDSPRGEDLDTIGNRYDLDIKDTIPELSNEFCTAYAATDRNSEYKNVYALVGLNSLPFRDRATDVMQKDTVPYLARCHASGPVTLSSTKETHRGFIMTRPAGKNLSDIIAHSGALPESFVTKQVIKPLASMLSELSKHGINHGCINANTVYFDKHITVGECAALPSGFLQPANYESPERNLALKAGKGAGDPSGDYYSLGILALHLILGYLPNEDKSKNELIEEIVSNGAYNSFMPKFEFSIAMQDFFRGTLNENKADRWDLSHIDGWLRGKRYTVVSASKPKDSIRPFDYRGKQYYTRQHIAYAISRDWKLAKQHLSGFKLMRWLESNIKKTDICGQVDRIIPIGDSDNKARPLKDEELARLLSALDPSAPIRYRLVSTHIDGLGTMLAEATRENNGGRIQQLIALIEQNLPTYVDNLTGDDSNSVTSAILWRLQGMRPILKTRSLGFGFERILYQLNPSLPCQQNLLQPHYIYTVADALKTLNVLAAEHAKTTSLADKHIAAFLTNRLEINREVRIVELGKFPDLVSEDRLVMLKILTLAQQKLRNPSLPGLSQWAAEMVLPALGMLHQKSRREALEQKVLKYADKGILEKITFLLFDKNLFKFDRREHGRAKALYRFHLELYNHLQDDSKLALKSKIIGQQIAFAIGLATLAFIAYNSTSAFI